MRQTMLVLLVVFGSSLFTGQLRAAPHVPAPLQPWVPWVLEGSPERACPFRHGSEERQCRWPTRLELRLSKTGGTFKQSWRLYQKGLVALPGDGKRWPQGVRANGQPAPVVERDGQPQLVLPVGNHLVEGSFRWDSLPQALVVPPATGLVALWLEGAEVPFPQRDAKGALLLGRKHQASGEAQRLDVIVHRKLSDDIPLELSTRIKLDVAGVGREIILPHALLTGFAPMALTSKLPARVEADGRLRVQVRPGKWEILLVARQTQRSDKLTLPKTKPQKGELAARDEVWVFEPHPELRLVEVSGVSAVDPQQTSLWAVWKRFSCYRVAPGQTIVLQERRRGDAGSALDQLKLRRVLWLDFDGRGLTISDQLTGRLQRSTRLEALPSTKLGRVAVGGRDQFITQHGPRVGVEVARGPITVIADSRYEVDPSQIPAVGWNHDVQSLSATLRLPPGWRLFSASGVDNSPGTWIGRWTLLDMFMVLVIGLAIAKLFGWKIGLLALVTLILTFTEPGAPRWIWPFVVVLEALRRVLPRGWLHKSLLVVHLGFALALLLIVLPFALQQVRQAIYPTLEYPNHQAARGHVYRAHGIMSLLATRDARQQEDQPQWLQKKRPAGKSGGLKRKGKWALSQSQSNLGNAYQRVASDNNDSLQVQKLFDPNAIVQTGPGVPVWGWNTVSLSWNGPVRKGEQIGLTLLSPTINLVLGLLRAAAILALLLLLIVIARRRRPFSGPDAADDAEAATPRPTATAMAAKAAALLVLLGASLAASPAAAQAPFPPTTLLEQLSTRLTKNAPCHPSCASSARLALELEGNVLRARVEVDAAALTAVPLPGRAQQWRPSSVLVDGKVAESLLRYGDHLWLALAPGRHQVQLVGPIGKAASLQLTLPLRPHRVEVKAAGWRVDGINEDGLADETLTLTRITKGGAEDGKKGALQPGELPPFVRVTRRIVLGLSWHVETTVVRVTPTGSPVVLSLPLLPGELVTSERFRVKGGALQVQLAPEQRQVQWRSALRRRPELVLLATKDGRWSETWELVASPIWHVEARGLPRIHEAGDSARPPAWRPWPGEKLTLAISRPKGIGGRSLTIDSAHLVLRPGRRATDATLTIGLRSSRGGQHVLTVPAGARVQKVKLGSKSFPVQQDGRRLTLPISPGQTQIEISWRQEAGLAFVYHVPALSLGSAAVNAQLELRTPKARWILLTGGARIGPVVLFWSLLALLIVVALVLSRIPWTPLRTHHWLLLGIGLSQVPLWLAALVAGWLITMGWRQRTPEWAGPIRFNLRQVGLAVWTLPALIVLFAAIHRGLLGRPDMQIEGNGSSGYALHWFIDRVGDAFPEPWLVSVPLWIYRLLMLAWALWLAWSLISWSRWSWRSFKEGGLWKRGAPPVRPVMLEPALAGAPATPPTPADDATDETADETKEPKAEERDG